MYIFDRIFIYNHFLCNFPIFIIVFVLLILLPELAVPVRTYEASNEVGIHLFKYIEENVCRLQPTSFMSDFEDALRNALRSVYPGVESKGCWFHFTQALRRKCKSIPGMWVAVQTSEDGANILLKKFRALALVPADQMWEAFQMLRIEAHQFGQLFDAFVNYFEQQWMSKVCLIYLYVELP